MKTFNWYAFVQFILNRMSEKSTWVSLGTFLSGVGIMLKPDQWQLIMGLGMSVGGAMSIVMPSFVMEKNVTPAPTPTPLSNAIAAKVS